MAEEIAVTLRPEHLVAPRRQLAVHAVAPPGERRVIDAERLEVRHGVLHEGAGKGPDEGALRAEEGLAQRAAVGRRHQRRQREIAEPLTRRQQALAVAAENGRATCRDSACKYGEIAVAARE